MRVLAFESGTGAVILDEEAMGPCDAALLVERLVGWSPSPIELREAERETVLIDCLEMLVRVGDGPEGWTFKYYADSRGGMWIASRKIESQSRQLKARWNPSPDIKVYSF